MGSLFNPDNIVMQFLSKMCDLIILNLLFMIGCIPIITIGASTSALYYVCLKVLRGEEPYIARNFWKAFRANFKQATVIWLIFLGVGVFLGVDLYIISFQRSSFFAAVRVILWLFGVIWISMSLYVFPFISHFKCTLRQAVKNSLLLVIGYLPYTVLLLVLHGILPLLAVQSPKLLYGISMIETLCGFSVIAFTSCFIFDRIFRKLEPEEMTRPSNWE